MGQNLPRPRRLAFVIHELNTWGGQDRSTLEIARRLSHHVPVDIYAFSLEPAPDHTWGDVRFHKMSPQIKRPALAKTLLFYGETSVPLWLKPLFERGDRPLIHATGACSLISDVVHLQFIHSAWKSERDRLRTEVPRFKSPRALAHDLYHQALLRFDIATERQAFKPGKHYIAIANCVARELATHFGITGNVRVIYHGVDSAHFRPSTEGREKLRESIGVKADDVMAVFVGAYERKGLAVAIESVALLGAKARSKIKLVAVGSGDTEGFTKLARKHGVLENVVFVGHKREILPYYQAADAFVLPTVYEPFGLVILEAMSCALPCVVSATAGASELIDDGASGMLVRDPFSAAELARKLEPLVLDRELRERLGRAARQIAVKRSWDQVASEYLDFLKPLLENGAIR